ncbi:MAG: HD domain-containing protein [Bacteroidota bacterium]
MGNGSSADKIDLAEALGLETALEHELIQHPLMVEGMLWGTPRYGHPEGEVYKHVQEVLANIDKLDVDAATREKLRIIALTHDTFKFQEDKRRPRNWHQHHAVLARRFLEQFIDDPILLNIVQNHDEIYYIWRDTVIYKQVDRATTRMNRLLDRLCGEHQLYYLFFKCDTMTGDKNPAPIKWVEEHFPAITPVEL